MGATSPAAEHMTEFLISAPTASPTHVETLTMVSYLHSDQRYRLSAGSTLEIGRPWIDGAVHDHLLVSLPYSYGPGLGLCTTSSFRVRVLWLVPISAAEAHFAERNGSEALERMFDDAAIDTLALDRPSVI